MDSLTHIAAGACIGEAFFEKGFGKKAMLWGILAQSIPDIDFITALWMNTPESLLAHRGFTHSFLFAVMIIPVFAMVADHVHQPHNISFRRWLYFFSTAVFVHLFLDAFNNYGIGWLEPFSHHRYSFNIVYVADPFFAIPMLASSTALLILHSHSNRRKRFMKFGLALSFLYLCYASMNKYSADMRFKEQTAIQHIPYKKYFTTPAPLQNLLWYAVAETDSGFQVGYFSLFDSDKHIRFTFHPANHQLAKEVSDHESLQQLIRFSKGYYTIAKRNDSLFFNDLRFGQILGWRYPYHDFVFHYYLQHANGNRLVIQRGRMMDWNAGEIRYYIRAVTGN